jgi:hypothetical protein
MRPATKSINEEIMLENSAPFSFPFLVWIFKNIRRITEEITVFFPQKIQNSGA